MHSPQCMMSSVTKLTRWPCTPWISVSSKVAKKAMAEAKAQELQLRHGMASGERLLDDRWGSCASSVTGPWKRSERTQPRCRSLSEQTPVLARLLSPKRHKAARGYNAWKDARTGRSYITAGTTKVKDEGRRIHPNRIIPKNPRRMKTPAADVSQALMSVIDMVNKARSWEFVSRVVGCF